MEKYPLNTGWQYTEGELRNPLMMNLLDGWRGCRLPHDFQISKPRDPNSPTKENEGWTQGAAVFYKKDFVMEPETAGKRCWLEFEGIAGCCEIWVNGKFLAKHMNPYTGLVVEATGAGTPGGEPDLGPCGQPHEAQFPLVCGDRALPPGVAAPGGA